MLPSPTAPACDEATGPLPTSLWQSEGDAPSAWRSLAKGEVEQHETVLYVNDGLLCDLDGFPQRHVETLLGWHHGSYRTQSERMWFRDSGHNRANSESNRYGE